MTRVIRPVLALALASLALVACSTNEPGNPNPGTTTAGGTTSGNSSPTTTSGAGDPLADFDPCAALREVAGQFNLTGIEEDGDDCFAEFSPSVTVLVGPIDAPLAEAGKGPQAEVSDTEVNGREAKLVRKAYTNTACAVALAVGEGRVDTVASADASLEEACDAATRVATAIEPQLPE
ncbi:hypothetical protein [Saccharothrix lopnurensis]|uniref:DUF3558 domain-containing protein n=1 Tax=Saccharothrix lopnurensis TaxID=1670621 RepID=A0ABW1PI22_9PSEU